MNIRPLKAGISGLKNFYEQKVQECDELSDGKYLKTILSKVDHYFHEHPEILTMINQVANDIKESGSTKNINNTLRLIHKLRKMMAEISVDLMDPDLVIMDEFQRFPELIRSDEDNETALLANKFFNSEKQDQQDIKILLLSATPYKLYSTLEEISENEQDVHYREFMQLVEFLFEHHPDELKHFKEVWNNYSVSLRQLELEDFAMVSALKKEAEDKLYKGIARTERMSVPNSDDLIDIKQNHFLDISEGDILSFIEMDQMLNQTDLKQNLPIDYVKSSPFLMSYMENYKIKKNLLNYFKENKQELNIANKPNLWLKRNQIKKYKKTS
ncbi:hypothetical protein [Piscibacillus salipiscarius]|uniref:hypothetical protein n=1 Tax=Piscibacillus salipiscarius TaxID=299480 RepID=UPI002436A03C|nr:hypothetical protein [Piscibacillus salipiscarius]